MNVNLKRKLLVVLVVTGSALLLNCFFPPWRQVPYMTSNTHQDLFSNRFSRFGMPHTNYNVYSKYLGRHPIIFPPTTVPRVEIESSELIFVSIMICLIGGVVCGVMYLIDMQTKELKEAPNLSEAHGS